MGEREKKGIHEYFENITSAKNIYKTQKAKYFMGKKGLEIRIYQFSNIANGGKMKMGIHEYLENISSAKNIYKNQKAKYFMGKKGKNCIREHLKYF